jgi:Transglycosylase SLT domain
MASSPSGLVWPGWFGRAGWAGNAGVVNRLPNRSDRRRAARVGQWLAATGLLLVCCLWAEPSGAKPIDELTKAVEAVRNRTATRDDIQAIARSAHAGYGPACELVAWMLATGTIVPQDRRLAFSWYIESYERGMRQSLRDARIVFDRMNVGERASVDPRLLVFLRGEAPPPGAAGSKRGNAGTADSLTATTVRQVVREEAALARFPPQLAEAVAFVESRFTPNAVSPKGARGVMQIMPSTAEGLGTAADALFDVRTNVRLGIQYLSSLVDQYGSYDRALAHYVGGTAAGAAYPFVTDEVKNYVDDVLSQTATYEGNPLQGNPLPGPRIEKVQPMLRGGHVRLYEGIKVEEVGQ